jgi:hypothetical protein
VALGASVLARVFIWERTSRSWAGGRVLRVREMASGQVRPGGRSTPSGRGGREELFCAAEGGGMGTPLEGTGRWL